MYIGYKNKMIENVPAYELHHALNIKKLSTELKPIELQKLHELFVSSGLFDVGGIFIFRKENTWAYRTNEFSNDNYDNCMLRLKKQQELLRTIVEKFLRENGGLYGDAKFDTACSLEKVHAIWRFSKA